MKKTMMNFYHAHAATPHYILGAVFSGYVYMIKLDGSEIDKFVTLDHASRGAGYSIRFRPTVDDKLEMIKNGAEILCSAEFLRG